jgi:hypothetical protein
MKHTNAAAPQFDPKESALSLRDITELLIKHYGFNEGKFELLIEFQIGTGMTSPIPGQPFLGAFVGVSKIGLVPAAIESPNAVDAAVVNPIKQKKTRK